MMAEEKKNLDKAEKMMYNILVELLYYIRRQE